MEVHDSSKPSPTAGRYPATNAELDARVKALEAMLIEKGLIGSETIDGLVEIYEHDIGPMLGAKVVARAWVDPEFKKRLLENAAAASRELGIGGWVGSDRLVCVENTPQVHNVIVCTLCSCYPWSVLGVPPSFYKSPQYRSRMVVEPRKVLADDFGLEIPPNVEVRVWDTTAEERYFVLPSRRPNTESLSEEELAGLVTRDSMIGVAEASVPAGAAA